MRCCELTSFSKKTQVRWVLAMVFLSMACADIRAQTSVSLDQITQVEIGALEEGARTQQKIDLLDDRRVAAASEYRSVLKQNSNLEKYNDQLRVTLQSQRAEMESLKSQINSISHLERDIVPLMSEMLDALETFVALDLPFMIEERTRRVQGLRELFSEASISNSEKYRRILEAYQIENDYGRAIEAYPGYVSQGNEQQRVTFLKIGRVAYLYQTHDNKYAFRWSPEEKRWLKLGDHENNHVSQGISMADEKIPSNLMFVPVAEPTQRVQF